MLGCPFMALTLNKKAGGSQLSKDKYKQAERSRN